MKILSTCIVLTALMFPVAVHAQAAPVALGKTVTGTLEYPALDNIDFREGTLEFWVQIGYDVAPLLPPKEYQGLLTVFSIQGETGGINMSYYAQAKQAVPSWYCSVSPKPIVYGFGITTVLVKPGEWHHIAISWKGTEYATFFDGKETGRAQQNAFFYQVFGSLRDKTIFIGDKWNRHGIMVLDDLRVSRVARTAEELGFRGELRPDVYTLLLDPFEGSFVPDGKTPTRPLILFNGRGGLATADCRFVPGKFGKGLAFYKEAAQ